MTRDLTAKQYEAALRRNGIGPLEGFMGYRRCEMPTAGGYVTISE